MVTVDWGCVARLVLLFGLLWQSGCGSGEDPGDEAGMALAITKSAEFSKPLVVNLKTRSPRSCAEALAAEAHWAQWSGMGLAELRAVVTTEGAGCQLSLGEDARREIQAQKHLLGLAETRGLTPDSVAVPLAIRNLRRVVSSRRISSEVWEVEVEWHWNPNALGEKLNVDGGPGIAWLTVGGDAAGWRLLTLRFGR